MKRQGWFGRHIRQINRLLLIGIVLANGYVIVTPFVPQVKYQVATVFSEPQKIDTPEARTEISRDTDHVVIPKINLDEKIWFGDNEKLVNKGVWHIPRSSTPDQGSNTVLVGHRFSYKDAAVFYHLDKLNAGDLIAVAYQGKLYTYKVREKKIVQPTEVSVEDPTDEDILTLYTCHPLWSVRERLVIKADLEAVE